MALILKKGLMKAKSIVLRAWTYSSFPEQIISEVPVEYDFWISVAISHATMSEGAQGDIAGISWKLLAKNLELPWE
jgi:hypothetical protein